MGRICRTCFEVIESDLQFYSLEGELTPEAKIIISQLDSCVPQLTLNVVKNSVICRNCVDALEIAHEFKLKCLQTEEKIYNYVFKTDCSDHSVDISVVVNYEMQQKFHSQNIKDPGTSAAELHKNDPENDSRWESKDVIEIEEHELDGIFYEEVITELQGDCAEHDDSTELLKSMQIENKRDEVSEYACETMENGIETQKSCLSDLSTRDFTSLDVLNNEISVLKNNLDKLYILQKQFKLSSAFKKEPIKQLPKFMLEHDYSIRRPALDHLYNDSSSKVKKRKKREIKQTYSVKKNDKKSGAKVFECNKCDFITLVKTKLHIHEITHTTANDFKCDKCEYSSMWRNCLQLHIKTRHTDDRPFQCANCEYKTVVKSSLVNHMKSHSGIKPFKCNKCEYRSAFKAHLKQHKLIHAKVKPFSCKKCEYSTAYKDGLDLHIYRIHRERQNLCRPAS